MYLDTPLALTFPGTSWARLSIPGSHYAAGEVPKYVETHWEYTNANWRRHRYEYEFFSFSPLRWDVICSSWGSKWTLDWSSAGTEQPEKYVLSTTSRSYASVQAFLDAWSIKTGDLPQDVTVKITRLFTYKVFKRDQQYYSALGWHDIGDRQQMEDYAESQSLNVGFHVTDYPPPDPRFVVAECSAAPGHIHPEDAGKTVAISLVWQNSYALDHASTAYFAQLRDAKGQQVWSYANVFPVGTGKMKVNIEKTVAELAGGAPAPNSTFSIEALLYRGSAVTDRITFEFTVGSAPAPNPVILSDLSTCSVAPTEGVQPTQQVGLHLVLQKETTDDAYPSSGGYLVALCHGKITPLWTGTFAGGDPTATRRVVDVSMTSNQLYGGAITTRQNLVVTLHAGNGSQFNPGEQTSSMSFVWVVDITPSTDPPAEGYGTISVASARDRFQYDGAPFTLDGPQHFEGVTPWNGEMPAGRYCITWGDIPGYVTPESSCMTLAADRVLELEGNYRGRGEDDEEENPIPVAAVAGLAMGAGLIIWGLRRRK